MKRLCLVGVTALLAASAHGQHPGLSAINAHPSLRGAPLVASPPEADIQAPTNAIPLTAGDTGQPAKVITTTPEGASYSAVPQAKPGAARVVVDGLHEAADTTLGVVDATVEGGKLFGVESDQALDRFVDKAGDVVDSAGHVLGAYDAYREEGAEGMLVYGLQEGGEKVLDNVAERLAGPAAPAWHLGRFAGDLIKENVKINGQTIESHVTGFYFNLLEGRAVDREFELNTSDGAIELHRQRMRRAGIFSGVREANDHAAASRRAQEPGPWSDPQLTEMMWMLMPAAIAASQNRARTITPPVPLQPRAPAAPGVRCLEGQTYEYDANGRATPCPNYPDHLRQVYGSPTLTPERDPYARDINGRRITPAQLNDPRQIDTAASRGTLRPVPGHK